jgi:hypothetical protein
MTLGDLVQGHATLSATLKTGVEVLTTEPEPPFDLVCECLEDGGLRLKFDSLHEFINRNCEDGCRARPLNV